MRLVYIWNSTADSCYWQYLKDAAPISDESLFESLMGDMGDMEDFFNVAAGMYLQF